VGKRYRKETKRGGDKCWWKKVFHNLIHQKRKKNRTGTERGGDSRLLEKSNTGENRTTLRGTKV